MIIIPKIWMFIYVCGYLVFWHFWNAVKNLSSRKWPMPKHARISKIRFRLRRVWCETGRRPDFVTTTINYEPIEILKDDHWILYSIDLHCALFVKMPKPQQEYHIKAYPFIFVPMFEDAIETAEINLNDFIEFSKTLEENRLPHQTIYFSSAARSASTLLGAMLHHSGYSVCFGEPHVFSSLSTGYTEGYWSKEDISLLLPAAIRCIRKCVPSNQTCIIKTTCVAIHLVPLLKQLMPEIKNIFLFRPHSFDSVEKLTSMVHCGSGGVFFLKLYALRPSLPWQMSNLLSFEAALLRRFKPWHIKLWSFLTYIGPYLVYVKNEKCFDMPVIYQNEVINDTENLMQRIFEVINSSSSKIPSKCIADAIDCLKRDAQAETKLSQENMKNVQVSPMTKKLRNELIRYTNELNIPKSIISFENEVQI